LKDVSDMADKFVEGIKNVLKYAPQLNCLLGGGQASPRNGAKEKAKAEIANARILAHHSEEEDVLIKYMVGYMLQTHEALKIARQSPIFQDVCEKALKLPENESLSLESLLIMPVQALPKRKLLLQELSKTLSPKHPSHELVTMELKHVGHAIKRCNEHLNMEKLRRIEQVHAPIKDGCIVKESRSYHMNGVLEKWSMFRHEKKFVYLFSDCLMYADSKKGPFKKSLDLHGATLSAVNRTDFRLIAAAPANEMWSFRAANQIDRNYWIGKIGTCT